MSAEAPRGHDEPRDNKKSAEWDRTHFGVVVPLGVVVVVAIVCIVVAALTSAHRADEVALANEQHLLTRSIATHGEWSLRRLHGIIAVDGALRNIDSTVRLKLSRNALHARWNRCAITTWSGWSVPSIN